MSDETPPPPLKLKARLRPPAEAGANPDQVIEPAVPPSSAPAASEPPPSKLRLKPRLDAAAPVSEPTTPTASPAAIPPTAEETSAAPAPFRLKPRISPEPTTSEPTPAAEAPATPAEPTAIEPAVLPVTAPPAPPPAIIGGELIGGPPVEKTADAPKFRFKPKSPTPAPAEATATSATDAGVSAPAEPKPSTPPPFPVLANSDSPAKKFPPPPGVPHVKAPSDQTEAELLGNVAAPPRRSGKLKQVVFGVLTIGILVGAFLGYRWFTAPPPPPVPVPTVKKAAPIPATPVAEPTKPDTALAKRSAELTSPPAKAIEKAQATIAGARQTEQARVDALSVGEEPAEKRALNTPPPSTFIPAAAAAKAGPAPAPITSTSQLSPGVTVTTAASIAGDASPAFRSWVAQLKISGVFHGNPPRALLNGRTFRAGQVVDDALGITFDHLDDDGKTIVFKDRSGATVARRY